MFKVYNDKKKFLKLIDKCKDAKIEKDLETGLQTLSLKLPVTDEYLSIIDEEGYIETKDYWYVIKEKNYSTNDFFEVFCNADIEELKYSLIPVYDVIDLNVQQAMEKALTYINSTWSIEYNSKVANTVEYKLANKSAYEILESIKAEFSLELIYDTKNKKVKVYTKAGKNRGMLFNNELRLKTLKRQGQSYNICTVVYPLGKDGLNIGSVNNSINFVENYSYTNKYLPVYYIDEDIDKAQDLKIAAETYLNQHCAPIVGYSLSLSALPKEIELGDTIILVDKLKRVKTPQRVMKIIQYPFEPEKDKVEISNRIIDFSRMINHINTSYEEKIEYIRQNLKELK